MRHNKKAEMSLQKVIAFILVAIVFLVLFLWSPVVYSKAHDGIDSIKFSSAEKTCEINSENSNIYDCDKNQCTDEEIKKWKNYLSYLNDKNCPSIISEEIGVAEDKKCTCLQQKIYAVRYPKEILEEQYSNFQEINKQTYTPLDISQKTQTLSTYKNLEPEFLKKVELIAKNLETKPEYLMAAMAFETGGTFDPCKKNPKSSATGLIQFMDKTAKGLGTTTDSLCKMSRIEQLDYVEKYFLPYRGKLNTLNDVYLTILYPVAAGKGDDYVVFIKGDGKYEVNSGLDTNKDDKITAKETVQKVASLYDPSIFIG